VFPPFFLGFFVVETLFVWPERRIKMAKRIRGFPGSGSSKGRARYVATANPSLLKMGAILDEFPALCSNGQLVLDRMAKKLDDLFELVQGEEGGEESTMAEMADWVSRIDFILDYLRYGLMCREANLAGTKNEEAEEKIDEKEAMAPFNVEILYLAMGALSRRVSNAQESDRWRSLIETAKKKVRKAAPSFSLIENAA